MAGRAAIGLPAGRGGWMSSILGEWREGKVRPLQGNVPRDRPVSRGIFLSLWSVCDDPFPATRFPQLLIPGARYAFFKAWRNLSVRCGSTATKSRVGTEPPPVGRPRAQAKERVGRTTPFSSSAMSSGRLFLDRVARQHCPSPLHRRPQNNTHFAEPGRKEDISTLPGRGHFYFALTVVYFLCGSKVIMSSFGKVEMSS